MDSGPARQPDRIAAHAMGPGMSSPRQIRTWGGTLVTVAVSGQGPAPPKKVQLDAGLMVAIEAEDYGLQGRKLHGTLMWQFGICARRPGNQFPPYPGLSTPPTSMRSRRKETAR